MKKMIKAGMLLVIALVLSAIPTLSVSASQATSYTYTFDEKGYYTRTQDAYLPDKTITDLGLSNPEDLFIDKDNMLYIADSGNRRIVKYSISQGEVVGILEHESIQNPRGVYVTKKGDIYVSDPSAKAVLRFDKNFQFIESFGRPDEPTFADTKYEPLRIAVDNSGNLYIISEGVYAGVIQLGPSGDFLGYFTVNKARLSFAQYLQNLIFTRAQLANLVPRVPTTFSNIFIDTDNIVYTTTMGTNDDGLKKHNTAGGNVLKDQDWVADQMTDLWVDDQGIMYTSETTGYINIYSKAGELIFAFGAYVTDLDISGYFSRLPSIAVDQNGNIWTADGEKGYLQTFKPTEYANMIYNAMGLYEKGLYEESLEKWSDVLRLNQMSVLAHNGVGKANLHSERYEDAMENFVVAGNREYYSEAFWEVRNTWIQDRMGIIVAVLVILWLISFIIKRFDKQKRVKRFRHSIYEKLCGIPVLGDLLFAFQVPKHPIDRYYFIRVKRKGSVLGASIIYAVFFIVFIIFRTSKAFIYQLEDIEDMDINSIVIGFFAILSLFIICNYLVTSIKDGDGNFKQVYMIPAYGLMPSLIGMLSVTILSYGLTFNEKFILDLILVITIVWSIVNIFIGFMYVHDYTFWDTVLSLILTAFLMVITAIVILIILIMWDQLWSFLKTVGKELTQNVLG